MSVKRHLLNLIADGKLNEALKAMRQMEHTQNKYFNDALIGLSARNSRNEREKSNGTISSEEYRIERNRIEAAVRSALDAEFDESKISENLQLQIVEPPRSQPIPALPNPILQNVEGQALKILMLTANPAETTKLNLAKEHSKITSKLQNVQSNFLLIKYDAVDRTEFKERTESTQPDILHFSGHGEKGGEYGGIILHNEDRNGYEMLSDTKLDALFEYFKDEFSMQAVVLNACFSQEQAAAIARHVPYVIGTTTQVIDDHAIAFSIGFYFKLVSTQGLDFEKAFKSGRIEAINAGAAKQDFILYKNGLLLGI